MTSLGGQSPGALPDPPSSGPAPSLTDLLALLAAVAIFCSTLEYLIPKPVPFFRIGFANLPLLVMIRVFRGRHLFSLALAKVLGQGLINGTLASYVFLFSLAGTLASVAVMIGVARAGGNRVSLVGISTAGALASNVVQVSLSVLFIFGPRSWVMAPPFLLLGVVAGVSVGGLAEYLSRRSRWVARITGDYRHILLGRGS
ncbi:Gx transporter family protein [Alkalispirochaeta alkalica]|uniref:Gx transporter family protein n=1 Tax=Alkalispirochaeta alkalica TaxID=46356 RepID=UPI000378D433|nr:Gx transporter family protein [Alkalispirochaeta alkalica]